MYIFLEDTFISGSSFFMATYLEGVHFGMGCSTFLLPVKLGYHIIGMGAVVAKFASMT